MNDNLEKLKASLEGEFHSDSTFKTIYATDASAYREIPYGVVLPKTEEDIKLLLEFARLNNTSLTFRGAGTSLAGQVTTSGIVVDVSRYMNKIISFDEEKSQVTVQPGIILSELNRYLLEYGVFFGPETSTANRCTIGGMLGNNACGLHSLEYGSTRDKTVAVKAILSDGSSSFFKGLTKTELHKKCDGPLLENKIYKTLNKILSDVDTQKKIRKEYPRYDIHRRNTGYALDLLLETSAFTDSKEKINLASLIAGSEGTLAFTSEITLQLSPLPPKEKMLATVHFKSLKDAFLANLIALKYSPSAVELADSTIIDLTKANPSLAENRFFIKGEPKAILIIELNSNSVIEIQERAEAMFQEMRSENLGYHFPLISGEDTAKVWHLRRAGLGVLSNLPGDARPVSLVEDTAVHPEDLPKYIEEFDAIMSSYKLKCVYHAHIGSGELHLRPILNLKLEKDRVVFREVAEKTAKLVKKYRGSLSGEHGDGRLRGEFIPLMYGEKIYKIFKDLKLIWDKNDILNPGKITSSPVMNTSLRYKPGAGVKKYDTVFNFSKTKGYLRAVEKCGGSGDCRKLPSAGGTLCPSFMATRNEQNTTRARANMLREVLSNDKAPFKNKELFNILDLCLSCKACKTECPAGVDMTKLKAEFLQKYYENKGFPFRSKIVAANSKMNKLLSLTPRFSNFVLQNKGISTLAFKAIKFSSKRKFPLISFTPLTKIHKKELYSNNKSARKVYFFSDEFTNYTESEIGKDAIMLLQKLGYSVEIPKHEESGRASFSKGMLKNAKKIAEKNIALLGEKVNENNPLIGIEPSAILSFRDEYKDIDFGDKSESFKTKIHNLSNYSYTLEEFLHKEIKNGNISKGMFSSSKAKILLHGHCQEKALSSTKSLLYVLSFPENYEVSEIPSGCCGMAGSFGYEKEHYDLSIKIGEMVLFPAVREAKEKTIICASGTSCRHQISDGTGKKALHPAQILFRALR